MLGQLIRVSRDIRFHSFYRFYRCLIFTLEIEISNFSNFFSKSAHAADVPPVETLASGDRRISLRPFRHRLFSALQASSKMWNLASLEQNFHIFFRRFIRFIDFIFKSPGHAVINDNHIITRWSSLYCATPMKMRRCGEMIPTSTSEWNMASLIRVDNEIRKVNISQAVLMY